MQSQENDFGLINLWSCDPKCSSYRKFLTVTIADFGGHTVNTFGRNTSAASLFKNKIKEL